MNKKFKFEYWNIRDKNIGKGCKRVEGESFKEYLRLRGPWFLPITVVVWVSLRPQIAHIPIPTEKLQEKWPRRVILSRLDTNLEHLFQSIPAKLAFSRLIAESSLESNNIYLYYLKKRFSVYFNRFKDVICLHKYRYRPIQKVKQEFVILN